MNDEINDIGIENLRFAIVKQAILDYEGALKWLRKHGNHVEQTQGYQHSLNTRKWTKEECEYFFKSEWFGMLCDIDGEVMMRTIRKKFYNRPIRWHRDGR